MMISRAFLFGVGIAFAATTALAYSPQSKAGGASAAPVFEQALPNVPGKTMTSVLVRYAPGGKSPSHTHSRTAFVFAYVLSGSIRSQVNGGPVKVYRAGESWFEEPGAHHQISENASKTKPASLLAVFVADTGDRNLTVYDQEK
ncbi:cupin domain-containing protein [Labrys sp. (in: a-proteobacteria)]|uniref:cupin domain-containing protein n=1 Tax=Labrys sp. (in: a-proteobacteria) TaxID=1917972 RepID=UPI0039E5E7B4